MKKVKTITIILAIILVTLVAFGGVYVKTQNRMENKVKDYTLGKELSGERVLEIEVLSEITETLEDGTEKTKEQDPSLFTVENYETVKNTIENRLNNLNAQDYTLSLNKENGTIRVELAEDEFTDGYAYYLTAPSKVQITEKDTETELLSDSIVKKAQYTSKTNVEGEYQVYLEVQLTKDGQAKIEEISNNYAILVEEVEEIEAATTEDGTTEETENAENTENVTENTETEENVEEVESKKIAVLTIAGTEYDIESIEKNKIKVKIGAETSNTTSVNNNMSKASELAMLINSGKYPVEYEITTNRYVYSDISKEQIMYFALAMLAVLLVILVVISIKYKMQGLLCSISCIGFIAILSLILRYTNVIITIEAIGAIIFVIAINLKLNQNILSKNRTLNIVNEAVSSAYKETFLKLIPIILLSLVFCFAGWTNLNTFGMVMFWGLLLIAIYNITVTKALLKLRESK